MVTAYTDIGTRARREAFALRGRKLSEDEAFRRFRTLLEDLDEVMVGAEAKCAMGRWLDFDVIQDGVDIDPERLADPDAGALTRLRIADEIAQAVPLITRRLLHSAERHARRQSARAEEVVA